MNEEQIDELYMNIRDEIADKLLNVVGDSIYEIDIDNALDRACESVLDVSEVKEKGEYSNIHINMAVKSVILESLSNFK